MAKPSPRTVVLVGVLVVFALAIAVVAARARFEQPLRDTPVEDLERAYLLRAPERAQDHRLAARSSTDAAHGVPRVLFQTYASKARVPTKVYTNVAEFAPEFEHRLLDDDDARAFLAAHFQPGVQNAFARLASGAHKADLLRYCLLYVHGGVYLDVKTILVVPLRDLVLDGCVTSVLARHVPFAAPCIYQGILAAPPAQPLFLHLIDTIVRSDRGPRNYHAFTRDFFRRVEDDVTRADDAESARGQVRTNRVLRGKTSAYFFFTEECTSVSAEQCEDGFDRYGLCCNVFSEALDARRTRTRVFRTRYADFPW